MQEKSLEKKKAWCPKNYAPLHFAVYFWAMRGKLIFRSSSDGGMVIDRKCEKKDRTSSQPILHHQSSFPHQDKTAPTLGWQREMGTAADVELLHSDVDQFGLLLQLAAELINPPQSAYAFLLIGSNRIYDSFRLYLKSDTEHFSGKTKKSF